MAEKMLWEDACMELMDRLSPLNILPSETRSHFRAAQKEFLLAVRSMVDVAIEKVEEAEKPEKKRAKIEVK
ncbi:MAG: hypothetical protein HYX88_03975 [Chloroflexi bacterium]|nr:hypothetical protein [Chloroflexota bacterium]